MGYFLQELKRRNVFRVGAAYLVVGWVIIQIVETVREPLGLPGWTEAFFIVLLASGLPVALIFAWAFELTPEGMKKTREVDRDTSVTHETGRKLNYAIIGALVAALGLSLFGRGLLPDVAVENEPVEEVTTTEASGTSIAVLPFVDMSPDGDQEYFSDGISEELLNVLARVPDLRVAARTSSFQFKGQNLDIPVVAEQLNVDHVLEGSVRKSGNRIRITAQLIEADSGYHLWSDNYDRELVDIFGIQDEISQAIVTALSATLGIGSDAAPDIVSETTPEAYNVYLLGQHLIRKRTMGDIEASIPQYQRAIELDPEYAPAHAGLALATYLLARSGSTYGNIPLEQALEAARPHAEKALALDPQSSDANAVMGLLIWTDGSPEDAEPYFEKALELNPAHNDVRNWYSSALDELDRYEESMAIITDAFRLDPLSNLTLNNYVNNLLQRRRLAEAETVLANYEQVDPGRGAQFRAAILDINPQASEAAALYLESAAAYPEYLRLRASATGHIERLGIYSGLEGLWPYEDARFVGVRPDDYERNIEVGRAVVNESPEDPDALTGLAFALLWAGQTEAALAQAGQALDAVNPDRRDVHPANFVFALDAWRRGDAASAMERVSPIEDASMKRLDSGIQSPFNHMIIAMTRFMDGDVAAALQHYETALASEMLDRGLIENPYELLGWSDIPEFAAIRRAYDDYVANERQEFLSRACGEIGFDVWRPGEEACESAVAAGISLD